MSTFQTTKNLLFMICYSKSCEINVSTQIKVNKSCKTSQSGLASLDRCKNNIFQYFDLKICTKEGYVKLSLDSND